MPRELSQFRYTIEVYRLQTHEHLGTVAVQPDWEPAVEWTWFTALRRNPELPLLFDVAEGCVEPCWDEQLGDPHVAKVKVEVSFAGWKSAPDDIPSSYFQALAELASAEFVSRGQLSPGEIFHYAVCAYHVGHRARTDDRAQAPSFSVRPAPMPLDVRDRLLDEFLTRSTPYGDVVRTGSGGDRLDPSRSTVSRSRDTLDGAPLPVFIPADVLTETQELMRTAGAKETGGILIGHVHRDRSRPELFLEVTTQIPAQHAQQELTQLTFTPDTWAAVDRAIALRRRGELYLGWWHTHPVGHWDKHAQEKPGQRGRTPDKGTGGFFSLQDLMLHCTVFPRAYSIALVLSDYGRERGNHSVRLYGWERGMIVPRGFHALEAAGVVGLEQER